MAMPPLTSSCGNACAEASSNTKLAGTALTMIGGLSEWYISHPDALSSVLTVLSSVLQSTDPKLSRNGATTVRGCWCVLMCCVDASVT